MIKKDIDKNTLTILTFLTRKLGYTRVPQPVPLVFIQTGLKRFYKADLTINQIQYRIKKLVELGHLEKWSTKHHTHYKQTYYRIPYLLKKDHTNIPNIQNNYPSTKNTKVSQETKHIPTISPTPHTLSGVDLSEIKKLKEKFSII